MFFEEVQPFVRELFAEPIAFLGGFASGVLRVDLSQDPVKSWLDKETGSSDDDNTPPPPPSGPQAISID